MVSLYCNFPGPRHLPFNTRKWNSKDLRVFCWAPFDWRIRHIRDSKGIMGKDSCKSIIQHGPISVRPINRNALGRPRYQVFRRPPTNTICFIPAKVSYFTTLNYSTSLLEDSILNWVALSYLLSHSQKLKGLKTSTHCHHMFPSMSLCKCFTCSGLDSKGCRAATWDIRIKFPRRPWLDVGKDEGV